MTTYIANLGCRWNSPTIGQIWGPLTQNQNLNPNSYRYLQYELHNQDENTAAWFKFSMGDTLQCVVYDLSDSCGAPTSWELGVSFTSIPTSANAGVATSYDPTSYVDTLVGFSSATTTSPYYLDYLGSPPTVGSPLTDFVWSSTPSYQSPWGTCYGYSSASLSFNFKTSCTCELSFRLKMTGSSGTQYYLSDPEARVTSGST